jgi:hypothetical protein
MLARITLLAASLAASGVAGDPPVAAVRQEAALAYRWTQGETIRYRVNQLTTTTTTGAPAMRDGNHEQSMTQLIRLVVESIATDGTATLQQMIESVKVEISSPMAKFSYDSAAAAPAGGTQAMHFIDASLRGIYAAMIGEPVTLVLSPQGDVQKVEGLARIVEKMMQSLPQDPGGSAVTANLQQNFGEDAVRTVFAQGFAQFPNRPLEPGDTWTTTATAKNSGSTTSTEFTLQGSERAGARHLAIATKLTITQEPAVDHRPFAVELGQASGEGDLLFDVSKGRLQSGTTRLTTPMTLSRPAADGTSVKMKMVTTTTLKIELVQ